MADIPLHVRLLKRAFPYRSLFAKMTRVPGIGAVVDRMFFENDEIMYIPIDTSISISESYECASVVLPSVAVEELIREGRHFWIMNFCICRESMDCKDYPHDLGCLFIGEASRKIDPSLGKSATREEALAHVRKCREAGLVHLIGRNKLDASWLKVSPGEKLLTVCNCCPCCCLWMMLPSLSPSIGAKVTRMPGVAVEVGDACTGCGRCTKGICFVGALSIEDGKAVVSEECRGCGRCVEFCENNAITLFYGGKDSVDKTLGRIRDAVDYM